jgi:hypothetical protein
MIFDPRAYGSEVAAILNLGEDGRRPMPLAADGCVSEDARTLIREAGAQRLFPRSRAPEAALSGLYLYFGCWKKAHETAQEITTPEGCYWHAIVHRQEPDAGNSAFWFRRTGPHAIFPALREAAAGIGIDTGPVWEPETFIGFCERARQSPAPNWSARRVKCSTPNGSCCSTIARRSGSANAGPAPGPVPRRRPAVGYARPRPGPFRDPRL